MEKYALHLAKPHIRRLTDFLTEKARDQVIKGHAKILPRRQRLPFSILLLGWRSYAQAPGWARKLDKEFSVGASLNSQSSAAVLLFRVKDRVFAATYGYGHAFIDKAKRENDFGLFVAVNAMNDTDLRNVEKTNLGSAMRDYAQSSAKARLGTFRIDEALDVIRKIAGSSKDESFGSIAGTSSLQITAEADLIELDELAESLLKLFSSKAYQNTEFAILDRLRPILDYNTIGLLDGECTKALNQSSSDFELAMPMTIAQPIGYVKFESAKIREQFADATLTDYLSNLKDIPPVSLENLKKHKIAAYDLGTDQIIDRWSVYSALIGSITHKNKKYVINEGNWYSVEKALVDAANNNFKGCKIPFDAKLPLWPKKSVGKKKKANTAYLDEGQYLKMAQKNSGYLLFDQDLIPIPGEKGPGVEVCDLLDVKGRRFIHVKKSSRKSSIISHHIKQASNAARLLKTYGEFFECFLKKCEAKGGAKLAKEIEDSPWSDWTVELRIGDLPNAKGDYTIPFFSRVSLLEDTRLIRGLDFQLKVGFIRLA
ncbi:TIGR04141 family sporadically distributed protein [Hyphococcus flavus]|uniref:TIGR04141 family sporadically distributed protein n=1 Tax=Hyphococcus flavus TaxID=1866326 RepID=A0AAE9ZAQ7_9PROT|nr:DUF6119 family protein [Hyphococcus flavus]WDI30833.1 TIGR04141 family sporadically distributed protein [Hyphococcus flavus]